MVKSLLLRCLLLTALLNVAFLPLSAHADQRAGLPNFADLAEKLLPAVVNISSSQTIGAKKAEGGSDEPKAAPSSPFDEFFKNFMDKQKQGGGGTDNIPAPIMPSPTHKATSLGSGFIIDAKQGLVVTNNHVIADADEITVILQDNTNIKAELLGRDEKMDLALLHIKTTHPLVDVKFGDSDKMRVGDWVIAIGNPFGLGGTVTSGIISARARDINAGPYDDFLQTDASINRGNSGGPMFNMSGEVIGINTAIFSPSGGSVGIGFAIPSDLAQPVVEQLHKFGHTKRGWLGVRIQAMTDEIAESLGLDKRRGALVASTASDGPAARAGILPGDVVLSFDGKPVDEMRSLPRLVAEATVDKTVPLTVWRNGKEISLKVVVGELESAEDGGKVSSLPDDRNMASPQKNRCIGNDLSGGDT